MPELGKHDSYIWQHNKKLTKLKATHDVEEQTGDKWDSTRKVQQLGQLALLQDGVDLSLLRKCSFRFLLNRALLLTSLRAGSSSSFQVFGKVARGKELANVVLVPGI